MPVLARELESRGLPTVVVTPMPVPTFALAKVYTGVPPSVTTSGLIIPLNAAVPLAVALVVRS